MWILTFEHFSNTSSLNCRNFSWMAGWLRAKDRKCVKGCFLRKLSRRTSIRVRAEMTPLRCCPVITTRKQSNTCLVSVKLQGDHGHPRPCKIKSNGMDRDFTWYLSMHFKISVSEDIVKVRIFHPGDARRELEKPAQQHLSTVSLGPTEEAPGIKTPNHAQRNLARLPAWLKMPDTAVLSSVKTGWCHQKYPFALKKVSSECLKTNN